MVLFVLILSIRLINACFVYRWQTHASLSLIFFSFSVVSVIRTECFHYLLSKFFNNSIIFFVPKFHNHYLEFIESNHDSNFNFKRSPLLYLVYHSFNLFFPEYYVRVKWTRMNLKWRKIIVMISHSSRYIISVVAARTNPARHACSILKWKIIMVGRFVKPSTTFSNG